MPKITAKKYEGDDSASWAVFLNGRPVMTGLTKSEVPYYKKQVLEMVRKKEYEKILQGWEGGKK